MLKPASALAAQLLFGCLTLSNPDQLNRERELNLEVLEGMRADGADLTRPLAINFHVAVPSQHAGEMVARAARDMGFEPRVSKDDDGDSWTVECSRTMIPNEPDISRFERELDGIARPHGGYIDGWGAWSGSWPSN